jgi:hypothetical protein
LRKIFIISTILVLGLVGLYFLVNVFFNPFDFGPCDGNGPRNGERKYYHDNGKLQTIGTVKDCLWDGLAKTFYDTGELESIANYKAGQRHGLTEYFTKDSIKWRQENFIDGNLIDFQVTDLSDNSVFNFKHDTLSIQTVGQTDFVPFNKPLTMTGYDEPFTSLHHDKLLMRGKYDFYVVNKKLEIEMNLRDTLLKYIPTAYREKTDFSGNRHTFLWHRRISGDTLRVKVFYDGNEHQSNHKIWEVTYTL